MKKIMSLCLTISLMSCSSDNITQSANQIIENEPVKMVSELNKWYQNGHSEWINGVAATIETTKRHLLYYYEGDTLINGLEYKKMYYKQLDSIFSQPISGGSNQFVSTFNDLKYISAMRQDSDMVYYIMRNQNTETLYADYNINLGDILNYRWNANAATVTEIDSIEIGSKYLTRYKLSNDQYFYEGIGASYGLFKDWSIGFEGGNYLSCFRYDTDKIGIEEGHNAPINYCPEY
ncbi:hypothetical protein [Lacinutrix undariae]